MDKTRGPVAIALVVDSSYTVLSQWRDLFRAYVLPLITRLANGNSQNFLLGFVTYTNAENRPTPILAKRYFVQPKALMPELHDDPQKLSLGRTTSNANTRMAALEGYAAALDMFEVFLSQDSDRMAPTDKGIMQEPISDAHYIIHIASCQPDTSQYPLWNQTSDFDNLSWKTLPEELAKRNIGLNLILLGKIPQFTELHTLSTSSPTATWFEVHLGHEVLLSSLPSPPVRAPPAPKRAPAEASASTDNASDPKKPKLDQNSTANAGSLEGGTPSTTTQPNQGASLSQQVANVNLMVQLHQKSQAMEKNLKEMFARMQEALKAGRTEEAERIKAGFGPQFQTYKKIREYLSQIQNIASQRAQKAQTTGEPQKAEVSAPPPPPPAEPAQAEAAPDVPPIDQPVNSQEPSAEQARKPGTQPQLMPAAFAQILLQQMRAQNPSLYQRIKSLPQEEALAQLQKIMQQRVLAQRQAKQSNPPVQSGTTHPPGGQDRWFGTLLWSGHDAVLQVRKDVTARVMVAKQKGGDMRLELWPQMLRLIPAPERQVSKEAILEWINRHNPPVCRIVANVGDGDKDHNESSFRSLITLLSEKKMYAVCSWKQTPDRPNVVIFPFPDPEERSLLAVIFPETGAPDLPRGVPPHQLLPSPEIHQNPRPGNPYPGVPNAQANAFLQMARAQQLQMGFNPSALGGGAPPRIGSAMPMNQPRQPVTQLTNTSNLLGGMGSSGQLGGNPMNANMRYNNSPFGG